MVFIGRSAQLPEGVRKDIAEAMRFTEGNTGMKLVVALNYGGRAELTDAFNALLAEAQAGDGASFHAHEDDISKHLYTAGLPDPDLLIRTSGEMRVSNFLLWQIALARFLAGAPDRGADRIPKARATLRRAWRASRSRGILAPQ